MRKWAPASWQGGPSGVTAGGMTGAIAGMVERLGERDFSAHLLHTLHPLVPAASWSAYQVGAACAPRLFMSASLGVPDTTRACWAAYLSGPVRRDCSLQFEPEPQPDLGAAVPGAQLCHITATEVAREHRARVYEAHGMAERVSVVERSVDGTLFAVNFYRHAHQRPLSDAQVAAFEQLAPALLALTRKQVALSQAAPPAAASPPSIETLRQRLLQFDRALTARELDVCSRLLRGMTHDGIAADLAVSPETVKTYRNRAFRRLGLHFRSELFALVLGADAAA